MTHLKVATLPLYFVEDFPASTTFLYQASISSLLDSQGPAYAYFLILSLLSFVVYALLNILGFFRKIHVWPASLESWVDQAPCVEYPDDLMPQNQYHDD